MLRAPGLLPVTRPPASQPGVTWNDVRPQVAPVAPTPPVSALGDASMAPVDPGLGGSGGLQASTDRSTPTANATPPTPAAPPPQSISPPSFDGSAGLQAPAAPWYTTAVNNTNALANSYGGVPGAGAPSNGYTAPAPAPFGTQGLNIYNLQRGVYQLQGQQYGTQQQQIGAEYGTVGATAAQIAAERGTVGATTAQIAAQRTALSAQNAYLQVQQAANAQNQQEQRNLEAARNDTAGIEAASQTQNQQDNENYRYNLGGMQVPVSAVLPPGATSSVPGVRAAILTPEQRYQWQTQGPDAIRGMQVASSGLRADAYQQMAQAAGLTTQEAANNATAAGLNTREASNNATAAGLATQQAGLGTDRERLMLEEAQQPTSAGMEYSPILGRSVTPQEASIARANSNRVVWDPVNGEYVARSGEDVSRNALGLLSSRGNIVRRSDGMIVDSTTGNVFDPQSGMWSDPNSGNVYDPASHQWSDPHSGNVYHITNPRSGAGYWMSPQGFVLTSDGIWRDPATGQAIFNGTQYSTRRAAQTPTIADPFAGQ